VAAALSPADERRRRLATPEDRCWPFDVLRLSGRPVGSAGPEFFSISSSMLESSLTSGTLLDKMS
jgi:hypothetical protein